VKYEINLQKQCTIDLFYLFYIRDVLCRKNVLRSELHSFPESRSLGSPGKQCLHGIISVQMECIRPVPALLTCVIFFVYERNCRCL